MVQQTSSKWTKREKIFAMVIVVLLIILIAFGIYDVVKVIKLYDVVKVIKLLAGV